MKKYLPYILILIILTGLFSSVTKVNAITCTKPNVPNSIGTGCLTVDQQQQIGSAQKTLTITQPGYDALNSKLAKNDPTDPWTSLDQQRLTQYTKDRNAATTQINLINTSAGQGLTPAEITQLETAQNISGGLTPVIPAATLTPAAPASASASSNTNYQLLAPLPELCPTGGPTPCTVDTTGGLSKYLNPMIKIFIGLCAVLSMVMLVIGGIEYMTSELISSKEEGKKRIGKALLGLLIALGAYALLFTINPDLLKSDINVPNTATTPATTGPLGQCSITTPGTSTSVPYENMTETACSARANGAHISWLANP